MRQPAGGYAHNETDSRNQFEGLRRPSHVHDSENGDMAACL